MELSRTIETETGEMIVKRVSVPLGLEELMEGLAKEVILKKPRDIYIFAAEYFSRLLQLRDSGLYRGNVRSAKLAVRRPFGATMVGQKLSSSSEDNDKPKGRKTPHPRKFEENTDNVIANRRAMIQNHLRKKQEIGLQNKQASTETEKKPPSRSKLPARSRSLSKSSPGKSQDTPDNGRPDLRKNKSLGSGKENTNQQKQTKISKISPRSRSSSISSSSSGRKDIKERKRMDSIDEKNRKVCGTENVNKINSSQKTTSADVEMLSESNDQSVQSISVTQDKSGHYEVLYRPTPLHSGAGGNKKNVSSDNSIENDSTDEKQASKGSEENLVEENSHTEAVCKQHHSSEPTEESSKYIELPAGNAEEVKSAIAIQSLWRGRKERQKLKKGITLVSDDDQNQKNAKELHENEGNTDDIPVGKHSNEELPRDISEYVQTSTENINNEEKSAIAIQSLWRGRQVRKKLQMNLGEISDDRKTQEELDDVKSAIVIQSFWRGRQVRKKFENKITAGVENESIPDNNEVPSEQKGGNVTEKYNSGEAEADSSKDVNSTAENTMDEVKSAIALQSLWRGRKARQTFKKTKEAENNGKSSLTDGGIDSQQVELSEKTEKECNEIKNDTDINEEHGDEAIGSRTGKESQNNETDENHKNDAELVNDETEEKQKLDKNDIDRQENKNEEKEVCHSNECDIGAQKRDTENNETNDNNDNDMQLKNTIENEYNITQNKDELVNDENEVNQKVTSDKECVKGEDASDDDVAKTEESVKNDIENEGFKNEVEVKLQNEENQIKTNQDDGPGIGDESKNEKQQEVDKTDVALTEKIGMTDENGIPEENKSQDENGTESQNNIEVRVKREVGKGLAEEESQNQRNEENVDMKEVKMEKDSNMEENTENNEKNTVDTVNKSEVESENNVIKEEPSTSNGSKLRNGHIEKIHTVSETVPKSETNEEDDIKNNETEANMHSKDSRVEAEEKEIIGKEVLSSEQIEANKENTYTTNADKPETPTNENEMEKINNETKEKDNEPKTGAESENDPPEKMESDIKDDIESNNGKTSVVIHKDMEESELQQNNENDKDDDEKEEKSSENINTPSRISIQNEESEKEENHGEEKTSMPPEESLNDKNPEKESDVKLGDESKTENSKGENISGEKIDYIDNESTSKENRNEKTSDTDNEDKNQSTEEKEKSIENEEKEVGERDKVKTSSVELKEMDNSGEISRHDESKEEPSSEQSQNAQTEKENENDGTKDDKDMKRPYYHRSDTIDVSSITTHEGRVLEDIDVPNKDAMPSIDSKSINEDEKDKSSDLNDKLEKSDEVNQHINSDSQMIEGAEENADVSRKNSLELQAQKGSSLEEKVTQNNNFNERQTDSSKRSEFKLNKPKSHNISLKEDREKTNSSLRKSHSEDTQSSGKRRKRSTDIDFDANKSAENNEKADGENQISPPKENSNDGVDTTIHTDHGNKTEENSSEDVKTEKEKILGNPECVENSNVEESEEGESEQDNHLGNSDQGEDKNLDLLKNCDEKLEPIHNENMKDNAEQLDKQSSVEENFINAKKISELGNHSTSFSVNKSSSSDDQSTEQNIHGNHSEQNPEFEEHISLKNADKLEKADDQEICPKESEKESAIRIQTIWRGFQARKKLKQLLEQSLEEQHSTLSKKLSEDSLKDENENIPETKNNNLSDSSKCEEANNSLNGTKTQVDEKDTHEENNNSEDDKSTSLRSNTNSEQNSTSKNCDKNDSNGKELNQNTNANNNASETADAQDENSTNSSESEMNESNENQTYTDDEINAAKKIQTAFRKSRMLPKVENSSAMNETSSHSSENTEKEGNFSKPGSPEKAINVSNDEVRAAKKIQTSFRKSRKQRLNPRLEDLDLNSDVGKEYLREILKIQSAWRAYKVRKNIRDVENKISTIESSSGDHVKSSIHLTDKEILKAVTKIQAGLRGYLTRKHFNNIREQNEALDKIKEESYSDVSRVSSISSTDEHLLEILKQVEGAQIPSSDPEISPQKQNVKTGEGTHMQAAEKEITRSYINPSESQPSGPDNAKICEEDVTNSSSSERIQQQTDVSEATELAKASDTKELENVKSNEPDQIEDILSSSSTVQEHLKSDGKESIQEAGDTFNKDGKREETASEITGNTELNERQTDISSKRSKFEQNKPKSHNISLNDEDKEKINGSLKKCHSEDIQSSGTRRKRSTAENSTRQQTDETEEREITKTSDATKFENVDNKASDHVKDMLSSSSTVQEDLKSDGKESTQEGSDSYKDGKKEDTASENTGTGVENNIARTNINNTGEVPTDTEELLDNQNVLKQNTSTDSVLTPATKPNDSEVAPDSSSNSSQVEASEEPEDLELTAKSPVKRALKKVKAIDNLVELAKEFENNNEEKEHDDPIESPRQLEVDNEPQIIQGEKLASFEIPDGFDDDTSEAEPLGNEELGEKSDSAEEEHKSTEKMSNNSRRTAEERDNSCDVSELNHATEMSTDSEQIQNNTAIKNEESNQTAANDNDNAENGNSDNDVVRKLNDAENRNISAGESRTSSQETSHSDTNKSVEHGKDPKDKRPTFDDFMKKTLEFRANKTSDIKSNQTSVDNKETEHSAELGNFKTRKPIQSRYEAATKIQSLYRGYAARKHVEELKATRDNATEKEDSSVNIEKTNEQQTSGTAATNYATIPVSSGKMDQIRNADTTKQETQTHDVGIGTNGNVNVEGSQESPPGQVFVIIQVQKS